MPVVEATVVVGWVITTLGWIVSPVMARLLNEAFALLGREAPAPEDKEVTLSWLALLWEQTDQIRELRNWATSLRSAFYDVEDMVDAAKYDDLANKVKPPSGIKKILQRLMPLKKVKLQKKLEKLQNIAKQGTQNLDFFKKSVDMPPTPARTTISRPHHTKVFGRDKDRSDILKMLHEASSHSVIGIYGIAGSGKTTLAQYVCEYEQKQSYFSSVIWIDVSQCFDVDKIYHQMLEAASGKPCPSLCNSETLRRMVDAELGGKRFLMVLDGLLEAVEDKRNELLDRLNTGTEAGKILVTTRSKDVAVSLGANNPIKIRQLNEQGFLDLIMHHALDANRMVGKERRQELQELGREIAKRLERSPFVAKEVGGQPRKNLEEDVVKYPTRELCPNTMRELWQSYTHLDEPVRRCFAYCGMFPRMHGFKPDALIKLWMAQGFIEAKHARKMEDIGEDYFNELVSWLFMQSGGNPAYGDEMWFTIPDMLHELAEEAAGTDCLRVQVNEEGKFREAKPFLSHVRHLFITSSNAMRFKSDICKMKKLRTLIISDDGSGITVEVFKCILKELRKLRVVQIHHLYADKLKTPECVCDLKHLRFLSISGPILTQVDMPKNFGKLYHLQTIQLPPSCYLNCSKVKKMSNLINLRHTYDEFSRFKLD